MRLMSDVRAVSSRTRCALCREGLHSDSGAGRCGAARRGVDAKPLRRLCLFAILCCGSLSAGCVRLHPTQCGFLTDYSQLATIDSRGEIRAKAPDFDAL